MGGREPISRAVERLAKQLAINSATPPARSEGVLGSLEGGARPPGPIGRRKRRYTLTLDRSPPGGAPGGAESLALGRFWGRRRKK
eukprot:5679179-Pyramimonas_sp.AAC.1